MRNINGTTTTKNSSHRWIGLLFSNVSIFKLLNGFEENGHDLMQAFIIKPVRINYVTIRLCTFCPIHMNVNPKCEQNNCQMAHTRLTSTKRFTNLKVNLTVE